jgi:hypothetical protein
LVQRAAPNWLWLAGIILIYFFVRSWALQHFPPFIDEGVHLQYSENIRNTGLLAHSDEGRQFVLWWYLPFQSQVHAPILMGRIVTLLAVLPGFAAALGAAKILGGRWAAVFAALSLVFSPFHMFFERLILADPPSASAALVALYFAARLTHRISLWDALFCGTALVVAFGAKISALPYLAIPVLAALTLRPILPISGRVWRWVAVALSVGAGVTAAFFGVVLARGYNLFLYFAPRGTASAQSNLLETIISNLADSLSMATHYWGLPFVLCALGLLFVSVARRRWFLPLCFILPLLVLSISQRQDSRHVIIPMTVLLLNTAVTLGTLVPHQSARLRYSIAAVAVAWALLVGVPFWAALTTDLQRLPLTTNDHQQYVASDASGFGLAETIAILAPQNPTTVLGLLSNCSSLRYLALGRFTVECPRINPTGEDVQALAALLAESHAEGTYAVIEDSPYVPATAPHPLLATVALDGRPRLSIYQLAE